MQRISFKEGAKIILDDVEVANTLNKNFVTKNWHFLKSEKFYFPQKLLWPAEILL